jgi:tRNA G10  N-methylase Trm11
MEYLIRLIQIHETFRKPELEALAEIANIKMEIVFYSADVGSNLFISTMEPHAILRRKLGPEILYFSSYSTS